MTDARVDPTEVEGTEENAPEEPQTFDLAYVQKLRDEAAGYRVKAQKAEALEERLRQESIARAAADLLHDPADLGPWQDAWADENGYPDAARLRAAAEELVTLKPHLGRVRGNVGLGEGESNSAGAVDLAGMLRTNA